MFESSKSSTPTVLIISLTIVLIVAMICGMVMWIMSQSMAMNEKLLDVRLAEAQGHAAPTQTVVAPPHPDPRPQIEEVIPESKTPPPEKPVEEVKKPVVKKPATKKPTATTPPKKSTKKAPESTKPAPQKPTAKPEATPPAPQKSEAKPAELPPPPAEAVTPTPTPPPTQQASAQASGASTRSSAMPKRKAPTETPAARQRVGFDGLPKDRINLPVGNDDLDWQL